MVVYNIYFIIVILLAIIISCLRKRFFLSTDNRIFIDDKLNVDLLCKGVFCFIAFGYLIFLASQRYDVGFDYFQYTLAFEDMAECHYLIDAFKLHDGYEPGYVLFEWVLSRFSSSYKAYLFFHAFVVTGTFALVILKNSKSVLISAIMFMIINIYAISLNFSRQAIAMAILFAGFEFLKKRKLLIYALYVFLASTFHFSALIMLLLVVFVAIRPKKLVYSLVFAVSAVVLLFSQKILEFAVEYFEDYKSYMDSFYLKTSGSTVALLTFLIMSVVVLFFFLFSKWKEYSQNAKLYADIAFFCLILSMFMKKYYILDRLNYYFIMFFVLSIADLIRYIYYSVKAYVLCVADCWTELPEDRNISNIFKLRYKEIAWIVLSMASMAVVVVQSMNYFGHSVDEGSHKVYPYKSLSITDFYNAEKDDVELLRNETLFPKYMEYINNEDYIVVMAYQHTWAVINRYNKIAMQNAADSLIDMGIYDVFADIEGKAHMRGVCIVDSGKCVNKNIYGGVTYQYNDMLFCAVSDGNERFININGVVYDGQSGSMDVVVFSKSQNKVVDFCQILEGNLIHSPTLYHNTLEKYKAPQLTSSSSYLNTVMSMYDTSNTVILYNNNEDYEGQQLSKSFDKYYNMLGSTITIDALCSQNVAAMRFGGEWREIMYPASPAQIEAEIDGVTYDVYADSYRSYCEINGVEVSSGATGLNIIIISPEGEILFNGSVDIYSGFNEVTVNNEYSQTEQAE